MDRVPILKIGDVLLVSIQMDMEDQVALQLQEDLADRIVATGCHGVVIDISGLDIVDSFVGRTLSTIAGISRVLDAETVVVGMRFTRSIATTPRPRRARGGARSGGPCARARRSPRPRGSTSW